jgi:hypothetical protein
MGHSISGALGGNPAQQQGQYNPYMNQGMASAMYNQQLYQAAQQPKWMIDGVPYYSVTDFATAMFGDTPARTMWLLKYEQKKGK